ncbi:hypothetical protein T09_9313 [Trichinella sp. T9]|nr:hypothetical protein T09_9313 [Trichinella sp. T9]
MARMGAEVSNAYLKRLMLKHPCTLEIVQRIQSHNYAVDPIPPTPTPQRILTAFSQRNSLAAALIHASKFHRIEIWCSLMNLHSDLLAQHWRSMCDCSQHSETYADSVTQYKTLTEMYDVLCLDVSNFTFLTDMPEMRATIFLPLNVLINRNP